MKLVINRNIIKHYTYYYILLSLLLVYVVLILALTNDSSYVNANTNVYSNSVNSVVTSIKNMKFYNKFKKFNKKQEEALMVDNNYEIKTNTNNSSSIPIKNKHNKVFRKNSFLNETHNTNQLQSIDKENYEDNNFGYDDNFSPLNR